MKRLANLMVKFMLVFSMLLLTAPVAVPVQAGVTQTYLVLYKSQGVPPDAAQAIAQAGGSLVYSYPQIGVVVASSASDSFVGNLQADNRIDGVSPTAAYATQVVDQFDVVDSASLQSADPAWGDPMSGNQWDMVQIHVPEAQDVNSGDPSVVVGDIDTGLDYTHPDLAANVDFADSVSCVGGVPNPSPAAWNDDNGHGTHTAGTIAAAKNGIGIVGVAPNVRIAAIKTGNAAGYFFPEAVVCAFMWAGTHHIAVTNNSYFADPYLFNCRNDPTQRAIWKSEQRAIRFAMTQGVTVVAAAGNENQDLSKQNVDSTSPDNATPVTRDVTNACVVIPVEIPGVIGVSGDGNLLQKSYYSSYGDGVIQVVAPGGDSRYQRTPAASRGTVLSTYPGNRYAYAQGTSMASPHVAGVAALIISQFGRIPPGRVQALLDQTADPLPCPANPFLAGTSYEATCTGGQYNSFYGHGQVNAFSAVTHQP
jgi:subtilisin family serine protease